MEELVAARKQGELRKSLEEEPQALKNRSHLATLRCREGTSFQVEGVSNGLKVGKWACICMYTYTHVYVYIGI